jgi:uncharacterized protein YbjT (DUF2867 family)
VDAWLLSAFFSPVIVGFYYLGFRVLNYPMGFIGSHTVDYLLEENHEVTILDRYIRANPWGERVKVMLGDIRDQEAIERLRDKHNFLVIGGVEVSTDLGEILVFGLHRSVLQVYEAVQLRAMVDEVDGDGGVVADHVRPEHHVGTG